MRFKDIIGSRELKHKLIYQIGEGRVPHAQIFEGKLGYQPLAFALAYTQRLVCMNPIDGDSCGECSACRKISKLEHPDVYFIYPAGVPLGKKGKKDDFTSIDFISAWRNIVLSSTPQACFSESQWYKTSGIGGEKGNTQGSIGRAEADFIIDSVKYAPTDGSYRVFIIWLPERMNNAAANALLKLFEEPRDKNIFLFVSPNPEQILPTIVSRTQPVIVPATGTEDIFSFLSTLKELEGESESKIQAIASAANGDLLEAIRMSTDTEELYLELFISLTRSSFKANISEILEWVEQFATLNKEQQKEFFRVSTKILRQSIMYNLGLKELAYSYGSEHDFVSNFQKVITKHNIDAVLNEFTLANRDLQQNGNVKIVITHFALSLSAALRKK